MRATSSSPDDSDCSADLTPVCGSAFSSRISSIEKNIFVTPVKGVLEFRQKKITTKQFEDETLNRFDQYEKRKKDKLLVQKKEIMKTELQQYTLTPKINKQRNRDEITRNPLVSRLDEIIENRKIRIENKKDKYLSKAELEAKECTFRPNIRQRSFLFISAASTEALTTFSNGSSKSRLD